MTPRRVGFLRLLLRAAARRAGRPLGLVHDDVRQGWALATSPHGASQTIFRPGMSGVPDCARERREVGRLRRRQERENAMAQNAIASRRKIMREGPVTALLRSTLQASLRSGCGSLRIARGHQRRRRIVGRVAVLAVLLGGIERVVGGGDQPVRERADLRGPLRDADRDRDRDVVAGAAARHPARQTSSTRRAIIAPSRKVEDGSTMQNSSPPVRASRSPGRSRVCAIRVKCCRQASPAAWPWVSLMA